MITSKYQLCNHITKYSICVYKEAQNRTIFHMYNPLWHCLHDQRISSWIWSYIEREGKRVSWVGHQSSPGKSSKNRCLVMLSLAEIRNQLVCLLVDRLLLTNNSHHSTWLEGLSWLTDGFHKSLPSFYMGSKKATRLLLLYTKLRATEEAHSLSNKP